MASYWKSKVLPGIKKVFSTGNGKKAAAAEASKSFDESKEGIDKEIEEKKAELQPKVLEIYEAASAETKSLVKKPTRPGLKKNSAAVNKFLEELTKIDFPGSKSVSELSTKFGPALAFGPVTFLFEKVAAFLPVEEPAAAAAVVEATSKEIAPEELKKEEEATEKVEEAPAAETPPPAQAPAPEPTPAPPAEPEKPAEESEKVSEPAEAAKEPAAASADEPAPAKA